MDIDHKEAEKADIDLELLQKAFREDVEQMEQIRKRQEITLEHSFPYTIHNSQIKRENNG